MGQRVKVGVIAVARTMISNHRKPRDVGENALVRIEVAVPAAVISLV